MGGIDPGMIIEALRNGMWPDPARMSGTPPMYEPRGLRAVRGDPAVAAPAARDIARDQYADGLAHTFSGPVRAGGCAAGPHAPRLRRLPLPRAGRSRAPYPRPAGTRAPGSLPPGGSGRVQGGVRVRRYPPPRAVEIASDRPVGSGGESGTNHLLWCDVTPPVSEIECPFGLGEVTVYNAYIASGIPAGLANGAMAATETPSGRSYRCNTEYPCEEPYDLVFKIERLNYQASKSAAIGR